MSCVTYMTVHVLRVQARARVNRGEMVRRETAQWCIIAVVLLLVCGEFSPAYSQEGKAGVL